MTDHLHPNAAPLAFLVGTWRGAGHGDYPTVSPFRYSEETVIADVGKPFLTYEQRTWMLPDESLLHVETGYFRCNGERDVELVIAQPTGIAEVLVGQLEGTSLSLSSTGVLLTPTAKETLAVARFFKRSANVLSSRLTMEAVGQPSAMHVESELTLT